jgi:hypothetical protein
MSKKMQQANNQEITTVNIIGCCLSRNIFNVNSGKKYKVEGYIQGLNPFLLFNETPHKYHIDDADASLLKHPDLDHPYNVRMLKTLLNGGAWKQLIERKGDWIILDTYYAYACFAIIHYSDEQ